MKLQNYLVSKNEGELTFCLDYIQENCCKSSAVIVISGLSEHLVDLDYYMAKLSKYLYDKGYDVFQVDLYAHGDSTGESENISLEKLKNSILDVVSHIKDNGFTSAVIISRGIVGTLVVAFFDDNPLISKIISINPWYYSPVISRKLCNLIKKKKIKFTDVLRGYCNGLLGLPQDIEKIINVYSELGVFNNMVSEEFLYELLLYDYTIFENSKKAIFFETNQEKTGIIRWEIDQGYRLDDDFDHISLVSNAMWHFSTYETINECLKDEI
ncbi:hypothetical protein AALB81_13600 [Lachnospiraceae bacterium 48-33]